MNRELVVISGASKGIGKSFLDRYSAKPDARCVNLSRSCGAKIDLYDANAAYGFVKDLDLRDISRIVYMHAIGVDKFEPQGKPQIDADGDGIDDEVFASNYLAFTNVAEPLIECVRHTDIPMTICNIGSISDVFMVPYWQSFSRSKNKVRQFCKSINDEQVRALFFNVSSTLDENKNRYARKNADIAYWQTSEELADKSLPTLEAFWSGNATYAEFDFYKHNPAFRPDYFTNLPALYAQWKRDLGFVDKEIPLGLRI